MSELKTWMPYKNKETGKTVFAMNAITDKEKLVTIYDTESNPLLRVMPTTDFLLTHELNDINIKSLHVENGMIEVELKAHSLFKNMVDLLDNYMDDVENWKAVEIQKTNLEMVVGRYEVVVRKVNGKTQTDTIKELRQRISELESEKRG